ncbi:lysozyme inhibitor LprI family protein [Leptolyngbya iicbica]|uniref:DUF1311 domain-containing protein n=2 Tax=Cyanophyceae TaxID=3028117 RepID=A0A4Q7E957_9CYAN|nr:lysozyme inhibitor LprI family protein [Leptolyngbya sp. LK]RZM79023.1 DUF1311 domain-containing protein [Leptolyngbya sp. LK]
MTNRVVTSLQRGLWLSLMLGAIAACQSTPNAAEDTATDAASSQTTEQSDAASTDSTKGDGAIGTANNTTEQSTQPKAPAPKPVPKLPAECASPDTQTQMNICAGAEYERADVQLNNAYQATLATVSGAQADQLVAAEQAWITYRDLYCDFVQGQYAGGSIQPLIYGTCMTQLTQERTALLEQTAPMQTDFEAADQALNVAYQDLQDLLSASEQDQLTDAQLAWLDYRDAHCAFESGAMNTCMATVTTQQTQQLQAQVESRSL